MLLNQQLELYQLALTLLAIVIALLWFGIRLIKYRTQNNQSLWLLIFLTISNIFRVVSFPSPKQSQFLTDILLHTLSFQNQANTKKWFPIIVYCCILGAVHFNLEDLMTYLILLILMVQQWEVTQSPIISFSKKSKYSFTWNPDKKDSPEHRYEQEHHIEALSSPDFSQQMLQLQYESNKEKFDIFHHINLLKSIPIVIIDGSLKILGFNSSFIELAGGYEKQNLKYALVGMRIRKIDKKTNQILKKKREAQKLNQLFLHSSSAVSKIVSSSTEKKAILLGDVLATLDKDHDQCQIIDYQTDHFEHSYQVDISWKQGIYAISYTNMHERDDHRIKQNTTVLMGKLFRSFSHEFSTSLNGIRLLAESAADESTFSFSTKYMEPILKSCHILNSIVQDIRDYSMMLSKNFFLQIHSTNLKIVVEDCVQLFEKQVEMKGLKIEIKAEDIILNTDGEKIKQCLINLLSNAQKFTEKGSITISVNYDNIGDLKVAKIAVTDTGTGLDEQEQIRLQYFLSNPHNYRDKGSSYGIGLLISNRMAKGLYPKLNEGIKFQSVQDVGSSFWFYAQDMQPDQLEQNSIQTIKYKRGSFQTKSQLEQGYFYSPNLGYSNQRIFNFGIGHNKKPFIQALNSDDQSENVLIQDDASQVVLTPYSTTSIKKPNQRSEDSEFPVHHQTSIAIEQQILIVDDEFVNIYALKLMLERLKFKCDQANNGLEGYQKFVQKKHNIIFMDIEMPVMNGLMATQQIKQYCNNNMIESPVIIAQTAYTDITTRQQCRAAGMDYFLQKPISSSEIKKIFKELF